jgi:Fe-S-cluster containining protein
VKALDKDQALEAYLRHARAVEGEFRRVSEIFSDRMQCRRGCSMCCSQMFSISLIEAAFISRAVKTLDETERERLRTAARKYMVEAKKIIGASEDDGEEAITPRPGLRLPCPALLGDACSIYAARPLICRKWGIPLFNPKRPMELQACELNFRPGEEVDIDGLLEPQVALLEEWVEIKDRARRSLKYPKVTATVAEAILYDYEEVLLNGVEPSRAETVRD